MSAPAPRLSTWSDLIALPEDARAEVLDGEISMQPSPSVRHQQVVAGLSHRIAGPFALDPNGPGGWWFVPDVDIELTKHRIVTPRSKPSSFPSGLCSRRSPRPSSAR